jgi:hypothetical protein
MQSEAPSAAKLEIRRVVLAGLGMLKAVVTDPAAVVRAAALW